MKRITLTIAALLLGLMAYSQTIDEVLYYSNQNYYGTARSSAMGGAFSSLGGDISVANTNPAGLAIFRKSSVSITPGLHFSKDKGQNVSGKKTTFILPSVGFVFSSQQDYGSIKNWNFGIVYNQGVNFNRERKMQTRNSNVSLLDAIAANANKPSPYTPSQLQNYKGATLPSLAYNTYLISPTSTGEYTTAIGKGELTNRLSSLDNSGNSGEIAFSMAGNFENTLYFGATLGVQNVDLESKDNYQEAIADPTTASKLRKFYYDKHLKTKGTGVNLKLGLIYRPTDALRIGIAAHTPTFFTLEDEFTYVMESLFFEEPEKGKGKSFKQVYPLDGKIGIYEYEYRSPWKFTFGGSYIFGKTGLLSIDYDLVDYSTAKFSNGNYDGLNNQIKETYKMAGNLKVGAEIRLTKQLAFRGGYNYFGNIYSDKSKKEQKAYQYSAGLGYRYKNIFMDASYQHYSQEFSEQSNSIEEYNIGTVKFTIGYQF